jgi:tetratricopeptide (TPR) repeat protein
MKTTFAERVMQIHQEPQRFMTLDQELALAQIAWARSKTALNRQRLAVLAFRDDDFDRAIDLLRDARDLNASEHSLLIQSYLAKETEADDHHALGAAQAAFEAATNPERQATALADQAKASVRLGLTAAARSLLERSLTIDPGNKDACKRLAALDLAEERSNELTEWCEQLRVSGVGHARLHAARVLGEAARGDLMAARTANGLDLLGHSERLDPPLGWDEIDTFNAALAAELLAHKGMRFERYGSASNFSWRIEGLARPDAPLVNLLLSHIKDRVLARVRSIENLDHPWLADRPEQALLRAWSVITEGDGFEGWHVHQFGWLSGVYYVQIPDEIRDGTGREGCIGFGLPEELAGPAPAASYGITTVRPEPGLMLTFPSHTFHRTFSHQGSGKRICVAFDLRPL